MHRSVLSLLVVVGLLASAACAGSGREGDGPTSDGEQADVTTTSTVEGTPEGGGANGSGPSGGPPNPPRGPVGAPALGGASTTEPNRATGEDPGSPPNTVSQTLPANDGSQGSPGAFARTLLRPAASTSIVLERIAQDGATIAPAAISRSATVMKDVSAKPVDVPAPVGLPGGAKKWTADDIRAVADAASTQGQGERGRAVIRIVLLRGTFEGSTDVLGVAVRGDVFALFTDNIRGASSPLVSAEQIGDAVLLHELGHLLGLVDLARDTGRADPEHPGHSRNTKSVMYWAVESSLVGQVLGGPPPTEFDAADHADLRALRDGA